MPLPIPTRPREEVTIDFATKLSSSKVYTAIYLVLDRLTKLCHLIPTKYQVTAENVAKLFLKTYLDTTGCLMRLFSICKIYKPILEVVNAIVGYSS